jgi:hypothetical protein
MSTFETARRISPRPFTSVSAWISLVPMSDDWRLRVDLHEDGPAHALTEHLGESALEHDLDTSFHDRVVVSREGAGVFCYTGTREQAQKTERLVHAVAANLGWHVDAQLTRWHPSTEEWKSADEPMSRDDRERAAESAALMARKREALEERDRPEFEVRVQCPSHREALQLFETLRGEGLPCVRRSRYLLVGAPDEESASALAERLGQAASPRRVVIAEAPLRTGSGRAANPLSVLDGS